MPMPSPDDFDEIEFGARRGVKNPGEDDEPTASSKKTKKKRKKSKNKRKSKKSQKRPPDSRKGTKSKKKKNESKGKRKQDQGVLVPMDQWTRVLNQIGNLHQAGQQLADARERAARAETEAVFLRERVRDLRAALDAERQDPVIERHDHEEDPSGGDPGGTGLAG